MLGEATNFDKSGGAGRMKKLFGLGRNVPNHGFACAGANQSGRVALVHGCPTQAVSSNGRCGSGDARARAIAGDSLGRPRWLRILRIAVRSK